MPKPFSRADYPFERFTSRARSLLFTATDYARVTGSTYVGTEHLLLASFGSGFQSAAVLKAIGVKRSAVESAIKRVKGGSEASTATPIPTRALQAAIESSFHWAKACGDSSVGTKHLLRGLSAADGLASRILADLGVTQAVIEVETQRIGDPES